MAVVVLLILFSGGLKVAPNEDSIKSIAVGYVYRFCIDFWNRYYRMFFKLKTGFHITIIIVARSIYTLCSSSSSLFMHGHSYVCLNYLQINGGFIMVTETKFSWIQIKEAVKTRTDHIIAHGIITNKTYWWFTACGIFNFSINRMILQLKEFRIKQSI